MNNRPLLLSLIASLTLGLAPFSPEPHIVGKLRWLAGGGEGMQLADYGDLFMHGLPWLFLIYFLFKKLTGGSGTAESINESIANGTANIIDVREHAEVASGMIDGAHHMPLSSLDQYIATVQGMKGPKIVYCKSGVRSARAIGIMKKHAITDLHNGGGYGSLKKMRLKVKSMKV